MLTRSQCCQVQAKFALNACIQQPCIPLSLSMCVCVCNRIVPRINLDSLLRTI